MNFLSKKIKSILERLQYRGQSNLIKSSALFDTGWYCAQYPDVAESKTDPLTHYIRSGGTEGRDPHPLFDNQWYCEQYLDVTQNKINPLIHFLKVGAVQGHKPNPLFDTNWYRKNYLTNDTTTNPLSHYLSTGTRQNSDPSPYFSTQNYLEQIPSLLQEKINPLAHYYRRNSNWLKTMFPSLSNAPPALAKIIKSKEKQKILFVGHDASATGAPVLLLNIIRSLKESQNIEAELILLTDGPLETEYSNLIPAHIVDHGYPVEKNYKRFKEIALSLRDKGFTTALCNTAATGLCTDILYRLGFHIISTIHEMHSVIQAMRLEKECYAIADYAHKIIFPADLVRNDFEQIAGDLCSRSFILPQGLLLEPKIIPTAKKDIYQLLNIPADAYMILGAGRGDLRKGFDLFLQLARQANAADTNFHFVWVGNIAHDMEVWFKRDMESDALANCFHHIPFTKEISAYYQAADIFVLSSREDPFPSVVLDALAHGTPVIAFDKCGGYADLFHTSLNGELIPYGNLKAMTDAIQRIANNNIMNAIQARKQRAEQIIEKFKFEDYTTRLLQLLITKEKGALLSLSARSISPAKP